MIISEFHEFVEIISDIFKSLEFRKADFSTSSSDYIKSGDK